MAGRLAELLGRLLRLLILGSKYAPGVAGALLVCLGAYLVYPPAAAVAGGAFLLLVDRRLS